MPANTASPILAQIAAHDVHVRRVDRQRFALDRADAIQHFGLQQALLPPDADLVLQDVGHSAAVVGRSCG